MINFLLKNPSLYRFYQKIVRKKYDEYDFIKFIFKKNFSKKVRMLDICCGDSYILEYVSEFIDDYMGVDSNDKYLNQCKQRWKKFNFLNLDLNNLKNIDEFLKFIIAKFFSNKVFPMKVPSPSPCFEMYISLADLI